MRSSTASRASCRARPVAAGSESVRLDLTLWIIEKAGAMSATWTYRADFFDERTITALHDHFEALLFSIAARPDAPLDALEMLSAAARAEQAANSLVREERHYSRFKSVKPKAVALLED